MVLVRRLSSMRDQVKTLPPKRMPSIPAVLALQAPLITLVRELAKILLLKSMPSTLAVQARRRSKAPEMTIRSAQQPARFTILTARWATGRGREGRRIIRYPASIFPPRHIGTLKRMRTTRQPPRAMPAALPRRSRLPMQPLRPAALRPMSTPPGKTSSATAPSAPKPPTSGLVPSPARPRTTRRRSFTKAATATA